MRPILVAGKIENLGDLFMVDRGLLSVEQVRRVDFDAARVDTAGMTLGLPKRLTRRLGLFSFSTRRARTPEGEITVQVYGAVRLTIQDRYCTTEVIELS